jgi:hypothetical protein
LFIKIVKWAIRVTIAVVTKTVAEFIELTIENADLDSITAKP